MKRRRCMVMAIRNAIRNRDPRQSWDGWFTENGRLLKDGEVLDRMMEALAQGREFVGCDEPNPDGSCPGHDMPPEVSP